MKGPGTPQAQTRQDKLDQPPAAQAPEAKTQPGKGAKTPSAKSSPEAKPPKAKPPKAAPKELPRKAGDEVLAELVGPGVVVRMARSGGDGQLAFYFDGESQPRLECPAAELHKFVPELCEDVNPVLTCLAYRKSLKIVVRRPTAGQYRIEYLSLPAELAAESFRDRETGLSPSWLSAVRFRYHQHKGGVVRDYDPAPRQTAEPIQLPGGGELSVAAPGAGCVQWVRLLAARKVLENPDLWLEAWVDGEAQPAVSAPARFWFPAFVGGNNYANFVLADKNGITNRLAMPFGQGIKFRAVNRGAKPIDAVGLSISVLLAARHDAATDASRMRLRGVFLPQNTSDVEQPAEWFALRGPGRWVGLVYQQPDRQALGIAQVWIDQQPRAEWAAGGLDAWLGLGVKDFRTALTGRRSGLCWSYLLLAPVDFQESLRVQATGQKLGDRLVLYYAP